MADSRGSLGGTVVSMISWRWVLCQSSFEATRPLAPTQFEGGVLERAGHAAIGQVGADGADDDAGGGADDDEAADHDVVAGLDEAAGAEC